MTEHSEQTALFDWAAWQANLGHEPLRFIFAIPNGGLRDKATAGHLKAEGIKPGVPDLFLPYPAKGFHGLFIEMKVPPNTVRPAQRAWLTWLAGAGYMAVVANGFDEAREIIEGYLGI